MNKLVIIFGLVFGMNVFAAQSAKVVAETANVYDKPQADGVVVGNVSKDTTIAVSNAATNGFYKSRIPSGVIGWISGNDMLLGSPPAAAGKKEASTDKKRSKKETPSIRDHSRILISGGLNILNNGGFPSTISTTGSNSGLGGTVEMQFQLSDDFYWAGRAEYFTSSSAQTVSSTTTQTLAFRTIPVMGGIVYVPISKPDFRVGVGLYAGFSLLTSLTVVQSTTLSSGTVTYSSSDLTFYGNLQGSYAVSSSISILGEFGYRMHSATYPASTSINAVAFSANFGGIVSRLGVEFRMN